MLALGMIVAASVWADVPRARLRSEPAKLPAIPAGETVSVFPDLTPTVTLEQPNKADKAPRLQPMSRLILLRYVSGEFARAVRPLPSDKKGYRIKAGADVNEEQLRNASMRGAAANPGDTVQITAIEFREKEIVLHINGGAKEKKRWRDRISVEVGGGGPRPQARTTTTTSNDGTPGYQRVGSTLIVEFGGPVPDLTPDEFKQHIAAYLDFSKQRSASVHWVDTIPEEFKQAIKDNQPMVGMDREMVIAAMGRPEQKIRERDPEGNETEDWIYGTPPGKTIFVKFIGEKVVAVREFPR